MLKAVLADIVEQFLHPRNLDHSSSAESIQRIVGESAFTHVTAHLPGGVVGGKTSKTHGLRLDQPHAGAKGILFSDGARNDFLEIHFRRPEEVLRQIRTVEAY